MVKVADSARIPPAASAPIEPLAWEPPYAAGAVLEKRKKQTNYFNAYSF